MINILQIEEGLWVLEEEGQNVLLKDCLLYRISRAERKQLFLTLTMVARRLRRQSSLDPLIEPGLLKKLDRDPKALSYGAWEVRTHGGGGRIIFIMNDPDSIVVSAVNKHRGSLTQAIHRGMNRWRKYQKQRER